MPPSDWNLLLGPLCKYRAIGNSPNQWTPNTSAEEWRREPACWGSESWNHIPKAHRWLTLNPWLYVGIRLLTQVYLLCCSDNVEAYLVGLLTVNPGDIPDTKWQLEARPRRVWWPLRTDVLPETYSPDGKASFMKVIQKHCNCVPSLINYTIYHFLCFVFFFRISEPMIPILL